MREKILAIVDSAISKILSGRFILTVICGVTFAYIAVKGKIEAAAITAIIGAVFTSYFGRNDRPGPPPGEVRPA